MAKISPHHPPWTQFHPSDFMVYYGQIKHKELFAEIIAALYTRWSCCKLIGRNGKKLFWNYLKSIMPSDEFDTFQKQKLSAFEREKLNEMVDWFAAMFDESINSSRQRSESGKLGMKNRYQTEANVVSENANDVITSPITTLAKTLTNRKEKIRKEKNIYIDIFKKRKLFKEAWQNKTGVLLSDEILSADERLDFILRGLPGSFFDNVQQSIADAPSDISKFVDWIYAKRRS